MKIWELPLDDEVWIADRAYRLDDLPQGMVLQHALGVIAPTEPSVEISAISPYYPFGNVSGPRAVKTASGDYLLFFGVGGYYQNLRDTRNHGRMWRSRDRGRSWDRGVKPWIQDANEHCLTPFIDPAMPKRIHVFGNASVSKDHAAPAVMRYSDDDGYTWSQPRLIQPQNAQTFPGGPVHMRGTVLSDSIWLWPIYYRASGTVYGDTQYLLRSTNGGYDWHLLPGSEPNGWKHPTWNKFMEAIVLPDQSSQATMYLRAPGGKIYFKRTNDSGTTWSETGVVAGLVHPDAPPMIFNFGADGSRRIAFIHNRYDSANPHHYHLDRKTLWFSISEDFGATWAEPRFVLAQAKTTFRDGLSCDHDISYVDLLVDGDELNLFVSDGQRGILHLRFKENELALFPASFH